MPKHRLTGFASSVAAAMLTMAACGRVEHSVETGTATAGSAGGLGAGASSGQAGHTAQGGNAGQAAGAAGAGGENAAVAGASGATSGPSGGSGGMSASAGSNAGGGGAGGASGAGGSGGDSGSGGAGGQRVADGFHCALIDCAPGELCMFCNRDYFCSPDPEDGPDGYAAATAHCSPSVDEVPEGTYLIGECDGPEDCASGEYCVATRNLVLNIQCSPEPGPPPLDCSCLGCWDEGRGLLRSCTLCRSDADCGAGEVCSSRTVGLWNNDVRGCSPAE